MVLSFALSWDFARAASPAASPILTNCQQQHQLEIDQNTSTKRRQL